jgi:hypothetical protein
MKGVSTISILAVLSLIMVATVSVVAVNNVLGTSEFIKSQTAESVGQRIESGVYAIDAFEEAELEMDFQGDIGYNIWEEEGVKYLEYNFDSLYSGADDISENVVKLDQTFGTEYTVKMSKDNEPVDKICIKKHDSVVIEGGSC